jgi:hypothetical protein
VHRHFTNVRGWETEKTNLAFLELEDPHPGVLEDSLRRDNETTSVDGSCACDAGAVAAASAVACAYAAAVTAASVFAAAAAAAVLHSCTAPDSMRLPLEAFGSLGQTRGCRRASSLPRHQFAGRWRGNACGGSPPRSALLRSLSHSLQSRRPLRLPFVCVRPAASVPVVLADTRSPAAPACASITIVLADGGADADLRLMRLCSQMAEPTPSTYLLRAAQLQLRSAVPSVVAEARRRGGGGLVRLYRYEPLCCSAYLINKPVCGPLVSHVMGTIPIEPTPHTCVPPSRETTVVCPLASEPTEPLLGDHQAGLNSRFPAAGATTPCRLNNKHKSNQTRPNHAAETAPQRAPWADQWHPNRTRSWAWLLLKLSRFPRRIVPM